VLALLNNFARVTVSGLIGQDNGIPRATAPSGMLEGRNFGVRADA